PGDLVDDVLRKALDRQAQLNAANAFLARAEEIAGVGGWRFDLRTHALTWTRQTRRIYDLPDDYVPRGDEHLRFFSREAQEQIRKTALASMRSGAPWDVQLPMVTATGRQRWLRSIGQIERQDGKVAAVVGVIQDVTDARNARAALLQSEEQ